MAKKQFKAESKRLLDLMINSIYTNREIFLREIISNASDAIDKLCYQSLTDDQVGLNRDDFRIDIIVDKEARTITVRDNGIGMSMDECENNLGVIAKSGSYQFKGEMAEENNANEDISIIGQGSVGQLVDGVAGVGDDLPQEDLLVGVDGIDHQVQQSLGLGFKLLFAHSFHSFVSTRYVRVLTLYPRWKKNATLSKKVL